jgi:hypothetical protein
MYRTEDMLTFSLAYIGICLLPNALPHRHWCSHLVLVLYCGKGVGAGESGCEYERCFRAGMAVGEGRQWLCMFWSG